MAQSDIGVDLPPLLLQFGLPRRLEGVNLVLAVMAVAFLVRNRRNYVVQVAVAATIGIALFLKGADWMMGSRYLKTYEPPPTAGSPSPR